MTPLIDNTANMPATERQIESSGMSVTDIIGYIHGYLLLFIIFIGLIGNGLTLIVFYRSKRRNDPNVQYFTCVTIGDTGVLLGLAFPDWVKYGMPYVTGHSSVNLYALSDLSCKCLLFGYNVGATFSALCLATFTAERAMFVWFPFKRALFSSKKRMYVIAVIVLVSIAANLHIAIYFESHVVFGRRKCVNKYFSFGFFIENLRYVIIPCVVIFVSNALIIIGMILSRSKNKAVSIQKQSRDKKSSTFVGLLLVSFFYVVFNIPRLVNYTVFQNFIKSGGDFRGSYAKLLSNVAKFCVIFWLLNYCTNFVIYGASLPFYRKGVYRLLKCGRK